MWETCIRWPPLMGTLTSVGSLCSHLSWPFEESVLSLRLVLGLHRTVGIRQSAVRPVPDISPPSPYRLLCLPCGCLPHCPLPCCIVQWLTPCCSVDKGPFNLADKHCGRGGLEISYVLEAMTTSLGSTEQLLHHRVGRWVADEQVCPQVVCTSRSPSESHGPGISSRRKRPNVESRCNTKPQTHTLVQLARSKYIKGVNGFKNAFMSSKL